MHYIKYKDSNILQMVKLNENINIGHRIKYFRNKMGISQDRLSKIADVTYNTIIKIESGANPNPTIKTLKNISDALGVGVDKLLKNQQTK